MYIINGTTEHCAYYLLPSSAVPYMITQLETKEGRAYVTKEKRSVKDMLHISKQALYSYLQIKLMHQHLPRSSKISKQNCK